jgi:antitoxin ParD1/3/4
LKSSPITVIDCKSGEISMAISADLGQVLEKYVETLVEKGRYNSKSEVIREGIRLVQEREARLAALDAAIELGLDDIRNGRTTPAEEVFAELRGRYEAMLTKAVA